MWPKPMRDSDVSCGGGSDDGGGSVLGALLGSHRAVVNTLSRISHWLVPVIFIAVGVLILITTGAATLITDAV